MSFDFRPVQPQKGEVGLTFCRPFEGPGPGAQGMAV